MRKIKIQYVAIGLALLLFLGITIKGLNNSELDENASEALKESKVQGAIQKAIESLDTQFLANYLHHQEADPDTSLEGLGDQIQAYEFLLERNQLSDNSKVRFAKLKIERAREDADVMKGVTTLLGVIRNDSNNIAALEVLGEMSIKSGQYLKAKERYQKLLNLQPENKRYKQMLEMINLEIGQDAGGR